MTMLIAGHETTAAVLTWTVYCLTSHPEVVARIHKEVSTICIKTAFGLLYVELMLQQLMHSCWLRYHLQCLWAANMGHCKAWLTVLDCAALCCSVLCCAVLS